MTKTAAVISGNKVSNIIVVDDIDVSASELNCTLVEYTNENPAAIGWTYDSNTGTFTEPIE